MPLFRESAIDAPKAFETAVIKKIAWRILPLILVAYCIAYVDRSNIAVAALTMNKDLGFSAFTYGLGAGIFFLGYSIFEIPSNLILERVGARRWIARIMFTWGILSAACAFVTGPTSFIVIRFLLGVAEAGFFPGVVLYFTYWFPDRYRGRILATLFLAVPVANAFSNVVSGAILEMNGRLGLRGWQWVIWMLTVTAGYGTTFFLPQIVKGLGLSNLMTGVASAIPYLVGMIALLIWGWSTDRSRERRWHFIVASVIGSVGFAAAGLLGSSFWSLAAMSLALAGLYGARPTFWPLPSMFLSGTAAAGGIALINSIGNVGGYLGPFIVGWIKDSTNSFEMALYFLATCSLASGAVAFFARRACDAPTAPRNRVSTLSLS
jgi:MFS family permease